MIDSVTGWFEVTTKYNDKGAISIAKFVGTTWLLRKRIYWS